MLNSFQAWAKEQASQAGLSLTTVGNWVVIEYPDHETIECMSTEGVLKALKPFNPNTTHNH
jgi:hypothetical protein